MRIISKFRDYYDIGLGMGYDENVVFVRERAEHPSERNKASPEVEAMKNAFDDCWGDIRVTYDGDRIKRHHRLMFRGTYSLDVFQIFFCGNIYHVVRSYDHDQWTRGETGFVINRTDSEFLASVSDAPARWYGQASPEELAKMIYDAKPIDPEPFIEAGVSVAVWGPENFVVNEELKQFQLASVIDPYTAFQELSMWVGGVLAVKETIKEIPDEYKLLGKGFDRWSFKRRPG